MGMTFANRLDAGRQLGAALLAHRPADPIVVGISRGGVPVAAEVAHVLRAPLEICVVRKLFSPGSPSFAIGAIAEPDTVYLDDAEITKLALTPSDVRAAIALEAMEVARIGELLREQPPRSPRGRDVLLVDDGVTTIATLLAAVRSVRAQEPASVTLAVPLADRELLEQLRPHFDRVVCLAAEEMLVALGSRYRDFWPVSENEVAAMLAAAPREDDQPRRRAS
jgi:putative phosphoribosyl transferase